MIDHAVVEWADHVIGKLQERGIPLPEILTHTGFMCISAGALYATAFAMDGRWGWAASVTAAWLLIALPFFASELPRYRRDAKRMHERSVQERYKSYALRARHGYRGLRLLLLLVTPLALVVTLAEPRVVHVTALMAMVTALISNYSECAFPRYPNRTSTAHSLAFGD